MSKCVKIKDAFELQMGKTPARNKAQYWGENNKWISIADIGKSEKIISDTKECITDLAVSESGIKVVPKGTVIMSFKLSIGKTAITADDMFTNEAIMAFINKGIYDIDTDYFYHYCNGNDWLAGSNKAVKGITLNKATLAEKTIKIPDIEEQKHIASELDAVDDLVRIKKEELENLEQLIKSRFVEMFGNCKNMVVLNDLCSIITDGTHQPPKFQSEGIPFIFVSNLANNEVTYNAEKFISEETYNELIKRTPIEIGDIILTTVGSYGHPAVIVEDRKFLFQRHIAYLKPKHQLVNSYYLHSALLAPDGQRQIEEKVKGIAQKTLNLSEIRKIMIPIPSMEMQATFELFVKQTGKAKQVIKQQLEELETLKKSLMQKYFG